MSKTARFLILAFLLINITSTFAQNKEETYVHQYLKIEMDGLKTEDEQKIIFDQLDKIVTPIVKDEYINLLVGQYNAPLGDKGDKQDVILALLNNIDCLFKTNNVIEWEPVNTLFAALTPVNGVFTFDCDTSSMIYIEILERLFSKENLPVELLDRKPMNGVVGHMLINWFNKGYVNWETTGGWSNTWDYDVYKNVKEISIPSNKFYSYAYLLNSLEKEDLKRYSNAIDGINKAIELDPKNSELYNGRGYLKNKIEDYEGAIIDFNQSITLNPKYAYPYNNRGDAESNIGMYDDAMKDINKSLELDSKNPYAYVNRGKLQYECNDYALALADYNKAIELDPKKADAYSGRALVKEKLGDHEGAKEDTKKSEELTKN